MRTLVAPSCLLVLGLFGAGCASKRIIVQPLGPKPLIPKAWQSGEEELARAVRETREPAAAQLAALDTREAAFPNSDFADVRLEQKIAAYQRLQKSRELFDSSRKLLEIDPFRLRGLVGIVTSVQVIGPTDDDLEFAATACRRMVESPEVVYGHSDLPNRPPIVTAALATLGWIDIQRHDNTSAISDFYSLLALDPTQVSASWQLANVLREDPSAQRTAIYHFTRAAVYEGPNALPPEQRKVALEYVTRIYRLYFGSAEGFDNLAAIARTNAFPSGEFR